MENKKKSTLWVRVLYAFTVIILKSPSKEKKELYRLKKTSAELIDGFIYIVIEGRVAGRSPYLHFYSKDAAGMRIKKMGEKSPQFPNRKVEQYIQRKKNPLELLNRAA